MLDHEDRHRDDRGQDQERASDVEPYQGHVRPVGERRPVAAARLARLVAHLGRYAAARNNEQDGRDDEADAVERNDEAQAGSLAERERESGERLPERETDEACATDPAEPELEVA